LVTLFANLLGAALGFYLGFKLGHPVCVRLFGEKNVLKAEKFFQKWGEFGVFIMAFTPLPFKVAAWSAGIFEMRFWRFLAAAFIGRFAHFLSALAVVAFGFEALAFFIK
jgi:membrane protein YqaA with SNARE-associated domain